MPDVGAAIQARLEEFEPFWTAISGNLDWTASLPETPFPHAVGLFVTRDRPDHYTGSDMAYSRFQLDVYSTVSAGEAAAICEEGINALQPEGAAKGVRFERAIEVDGPTDSGDQTDTLYIYRARTDFGLLHADEGVS